MLIWMFRRRLSRALRETIQFGEDFRQLSDDASTDFRQLSEKTTEATNVVTEAMTTEAANRSMLPKVPSKEAATRSSGY